MDRGPGPGLGTGLKVLRSWSGPTEAGPGLWVRPRPVLGPDPATLSIDIILSAVLLHDRMLKLSIKCYNWAEKSWKGNLLVHYKPAVAYAVTKTFNDRPQMSGILAIGPMR